MQKVLKIEPGKSSVAVLNLLFSFALNYFGAVSI
jgi:hypothetical protein